MIRRVVPFVLFVAFVVSSVFAQGVQGRLKPAPTYEVPRTPWGDPDLQGVWPSTDFAGVPLERAPQFGTRNRLTDLEMLGRELHERNQREGFERDGALRSSGAPGHWIEWGTTQRQ